MSDSGASTEKIRSIRAAFGPAIGAQLTGYSIAELLADDGTWTAWPDLPIRMQWQSDRFISVAWSRFDDLWIANDLSLPFPLNGMSVRWLNNAHARLSPVVGATIESAFIGRGGMTVKNRDVEIWSRLLIRTSQGWLEIFNALDENGYEYHSERPPGDFIACV